MSNLHALQKELHLVSDFTHLSASDIVALTSILSGAPPISDAASNQKRIETYKSYVKAQVKELPSHLAYSSRYSVSNSLLRHISKRRGSHCALHAPLVEQLIRSILSWIRHEVSEYIPAFLEPLRRSGALTSTEKETLEILEVLSDMWSKSKSLQYPLSGSSRDEQLTLCHACTLARIGSNVHAITVLQACISAYTSSSRGEEKRLLWLQGWIDVLDIDQHHIKAGLTKAEKLRVSLKMKIGNVRRGTHMEIPSASSTPLQPQSTPPTVHHKITTSRSTSTRAQRISAAEEARHSQQPSQVSDQFDLEEAAKPSYPPESARQPSPRPPSERPETPPYYWLNAFTPQIPPQGVSRPESPRRRPGRPPPRPETNLYSYKDPYMRPRARQAPVWQNSQLYDRQGMPVPLHQQSTAGSTPEMIGTPESTFSDSTISPADSFSQRGSNGVARSRYSLIPKPLNVGKVTATPRTVPEMRYSMYPYEEIFGEEEEAEEGEEGGVEEITNDNSGPSAEQTPVDSSPHPSDHVKVREIKADGSRITVWPTLDS